MATAQQRPNILWICSDQQRFDTLGCYGNRFVRTPHLDALAAQGVLFDSAYCQSPVCTPSRASFLTGRYPRTTRCRQNGQSIPPDEVLVTRLLAEAGYVCGLSGKLHISACHPTAAPVTEARISDGYSIFNWSHHPGAIGAQGNWPANQYSQWLAELGTDFATRPLPQSTFARFGMPMQHHQTTWCVDRAIAFMQHAGHLDSRGEPCRPWLFSLNLFDPHHPFDPPEEFLRPYLDRLDDIPLPDYLEGELQGKPVWQEIDHRGAYGGRGMSFARMSPQDHRVVRAAYWAMVDLIDHQVGRLLDSLRASGQLDHTLVLYMSDHGEMLGDHGIYLKGPYFYEPAVHVPLIASWPAAIPPGRRSPAFVELVDIAPTLLEAAGLPRHPGMQGRSLWPLMTGHADATAHRCGGEACRDDVYCEFYNANFNYDPKPFATMVRDARHKLVAVHGADRGELYDLQADPGEHHNLWDDPAAQPAKVRMLQRLCDRMAATVDPLPLRAAAW